MIIRKNTLSKKEKETKDKPASKRNIIKKEEIADLKYLNTEQAVNTNTLEKPAEMVKPPKKEETQEFEEFEKIDISSIEFKERVERRRGDRRRGYRRIDERSLVSRAQQEAHSIKELAAKEGYKNGLAKAQSEIEEIKASIVEFLSAKDDMYDSFYPHVMELSLEIAKKIIKKEVELTDDVLKNVIMSTLEELNSDAEKITIKVNPEDVEFASASLPEILETKKLSVKALVAADETIEKGSCIVIANNGVIDANFKTQLCVLQNAFGIYKGGI